MSVNKAILVGRIGKDPEIRAFENGVKKASFPMATSEYYKDKEGKRVEQTEWHNIVCWRKLAEFSEQFLTKGKLIYVEGRIRTRSWEDNGVKKYTTEIEANSRWPPKWTRLRRRPIPPRTLHRTRSLTTCRSKRTAKLL